MRKKKMRALLAAAAVCASLASCALPASCACAAEMAPGTETEAAAGTQEEAEIPKTTLGRQICRDAKSWVGRISYRLGANEELVDGGESDCSWFIFHIFAKYGLMDEWAKSTTWGSGNVPGTVEVESMERACPGDVLFWGEGYDQEGNARGHVVIYIGNYMAVGCNGSSPTTGEVMLTNYRAPGGGREPDSIWRLAALEEPEGTWLYGCERISAPVDGHKHALFPASDTGKAITVRESKNGKRKAVLVRPFDGTAFSVFRMKQLGDGTWKLRSYGSEGYWTASGDRVKLRKEKELPAQSWQLAEHDDGSVSLVNCEQGRPLILAPNEKGDGFVLRLGEAAENEPARFFLTDMTGFYPA